MYSNKVMDLFKNPKNAGRIVKPDGIAELFNADETANVEFSLRVEANTILDCKFRAQANPYIIATCSYIADNVVGKMVSMVNLEVADVVKNLGESEVDINFCFDCLKLAIANYFEKLEKNRK